MKKGLFLITSILLFWSCNKFSEADKGKILIQTPYGDIKIRLYDDTPIHSNNFKKLVKSGYYNGTTFHRVIKEFMIQGGDSLTKVPGQEQRWGQGGPGYELDAEILPKYFHKRGALAAARLDDRMNPSRKSSGSQFYIVQGRDSITDQDLETAEYEIQNKQYLNYFINFILRPHMEWVRKVNMDSLRKSNVNEFNKIDKKVQQMVSDSFKVDVVPYKMSEEQKKVYKTIGGFPFLDGQYTVFGEVEEGLDVVQKISVVPTNDKDMPAKDILINVKIIE